MDVTTVNKLLRSHASPQQALILERFFKTGPGEYAEGDIFLGIKVPVLRALAKNFQDLPLNETVKLLRSPIHEARFLALLLLIMQYRRQDENGKKKIYHIYLRNTRYINNWDLVDVTAKHIVGAFLMLKIRSPLYRLAQSGDLWERRIAIIATFYFIEQGDFEDTLKIAQVLLSDKHDLIHKAAGWMLREVGKRDMACEERFLKKHCCTMPRTMLRYAIERFPEHKRKSYLAGKL